LQPEKRATTVLRHKPTCFMKRYIVEFIGTFFLVFTVGMAVHSGSPLAPLAIGASLMVMIFAGGHISGGHFNPAVTLAVWLRGKLPVKDVVPYWLAQLAAGVVAAFLVVKLHGHPVLGAASHGLRASLAVEFLFTFALAWVVLQTATAKGTLDNSFYGLAIGFTVLAGAVAVGGISGGAFNPAVGLGVVIMGFEKIGQLWVYLGADLAGGAAAALAFKALTED
jgi:aquaporin Z